MASRLLLLTPSFGIALPPPPPNLARIPCSRSHAQRPPPRSTDEKWVHDAYSGPGAQRGRARDGGGLSATSVAGTGAGFTGVSPRIEVTGLHYEVTTADLKVGRAWRRGQGWGCTIGHHRRDDSHAGSRSLVLLKEGKGGRRHWEGTSHLGGQTLGHRESERANR